MRRRGWRNASSASTGATCVVPKDSGGGDAQLAIHFAAFGPQCFARGLQLRQCALGMRHEGRAGLGDHHAARGPVQEQGAQAAFQPHDPPADHGFGQPQRPGGLPEAAAAGNLEEGLDVVEIVHGQVLQILQQSYALRPATLHFLQA